MTPTSRVTKKLFYIAFLVFLTFLATPLHAAYNITVQTVYGPDFVPPSTGTALPQGNILQIIDAGTNGTIDPAGTGGTLTGDDALVSSHTVGEFVGADGVAFLVAAGTTSAFTGYVRAYNSTALNTATKYGDSPLISIAANGPPSGPDDYSTGNFGTTLGIPDEVGPTVSNVQADLSTNLFIPIGTASVALTATVDDSITGDNNVQASEYSEGTSAADAGTGTAMTAADGSFDSSTENVTATVDTSSWTQGAYTLWVRGQDDQPNWGDAQSVVVNVYTPLAAPTFDPAAGTYNSALNVTPTLDPNEANSYYTLDGSDPDNTDTVYNSGTIDFDGADGTSTTLKMISYDSNGNPGNIGTAVYEFDKVGPTAPTADITTGTYNAVQNVGLTPAGDADATYYTLDGSEPDDTETAYTSGTIQVDGAHNAVVELKAVSYDAAGNKGTTLTETYTFDKQGPAAPAFDIPGGTYNAQQNITITPAGDAVATYYTTNGDEPDDQSTQGTSLSVDGNHNDVVTVKAVSYDALGNKGFTSTHIYTFDKVGPDAPALDIPGGFYNTQQDVEIIPPTDAAATYYTTDGTPPDDGSTLYTPQTTVAIDAGDGLDKTLKAVSYDAAGNKGGTSSNTYQFDKTAPTVAVTTPAANTHVTDTAFTIQGTEDGGRSAIVSVEVSIDGGNTFNAATLNNSWSYAATLAQGANAIKVRGTDGAGNVTTPATDGPTITYYPPLAIKVGGQDVTGGEIFVPNVSGSNTVTITVEGGSGNFGTYNWGLNPGTSGALTQPGDNDERLFTADVGDEGDETLTITDPENNTVFTASLTIHVISLAMQGDSPILTGTPSDYTVQGAVGALNWEITAGANVAGTPVISGALNSIATVTPLLDGNFTIKATDSTTSAFVDKTVLVIDPIAVTALETIVEEDDTLQFNATGGTGGGTNSNYDWSVTPPSAGGIDANGLFTPAAGDGVRNFTVTATDKTYNTFDGTSAQKSVVDPLTITSPPANDAIESGETHTAFAFTGGSGTVSWSASAGSITGAGVFTAPVAAVTPVVVTITATDTASGNVTDTHDVTVYPTVTVDNPPAEMPTVEPGGTLATLFTVAGGSGTYEWGVAKTGQDPTGWTEAATYQFTAGDTGDFAGVWDVVVRDKNNPGFEYRFQVKVPFTVTPAKGGIFELKLADGTGNTQDFTVNGASTDYLYEILANADDAAEVDTPADYGTWAVNPDTTDNVNTFTPAAVDMVMPFYLRVTVTGDADLTAANGLNQRVFGPFRVVPVDAFTVTVTDTDDVAITTANVGVNQAGANTPQGVDGTGQAVFWLPDTGGTFRWTATAGGYITQKVSSKAKDATIVLPDTGETIGGTVRDTAGAVLGGATVTAYRPGASEDGYEAVTAGDGTYTINLPDGAPSDGWTVTASLNGYVSVSQAGQVTTGAVNFTGDFATGTGLQQRTLIDQIQTTPGSVTVDITTLPALGDLDETGIELLEGETGAFADGGAITGNIDVGATYTVVYDTTEAFKAVFFADTTEDNDADTGYYAAYVINVNADGTLATDSGQAEVDSGFSTNMFNDAGVELPAGGIDRQAVLEIQELPKTKEANSTSGSPEVVYLITLTDIADGTLLEDGEIDRIEIMLPIDLSVVQPGDIEAGRYVVRYADDLAALEAGRGNQLGPDQIIATDYVGDGETGWVTFWTDHLTVFGVGKPKPAAGLEEDDDDICFVNTAAGSGSLPLAGVALLGVIGAALAALRRRWVR